MSSSAGFSLSVKWRCFLSRDAYTWPLRWAQWYRQNVVGRTNNFVLQVGVDNDIRIVLTVSYITNLFDESCDRDHFVR